MTGANCSVPSPDDQNYEYYMFPTVSIIALIIGLPGNLAALYYFTFKISSRSAFSVYITNLAVADIMILCTLPFRIHYYLNQNNWIFDAIACRIIGTLFHAGMYMSICFMTCICVDRYMATVHPHVYLKLRKVWSAIVVSILLWCIVGVAMLVFVLMGELKTKQRESGRYSCFENFDQKEWKSRLTAFSVFCLIFGSLVPLVVILVCYPAAAKRISKIKTKIAQKAVGVIYVILAITVLCLLPYHLIYLLHVLGHSEVIQNCSAINAIHVARRVTIALATCNTFLDPVLYYITTGHCKWLAIKLFKRKRITRKRGVYVINMT
ncbi:lysophosphatidic acid receptor 6 [Boleophthalmus pectinirostris]|uniref:lysophosphatidic acid receptor 6 n=1 Tax=Boleophthalmus pectinirostris TaxID=150288 RepID=UPI000A1C54F6|nr:lysophosphatidic acid receptor 6 [Boleophthalmus pectinirostris]